MAQTTHGQPMPPDQAVPPGAPAIVKPRNRVADVALIMALLTWLAAALGICLIVASHAWTSGCLVDKPLEGAGSLCLALGGLLSVGAGVTPGGSASLSHVCAAPISVWGWLRW
jgi:hypothetical protein